MCTGTCQRRKIDGGLVDWDVFSPCCHSKWRDAFRLGHMLTINRGCFLIAKHSHVVLTVNGGRKVDREMCAP